MLSAMVVLHLIDHIVEVFLVLRFLVVHLRLVIVVDLVDLCLLLLDLSSLLGTDFNQTSVLIF